MRLTRELTKRGSYRYNFLTNRVVSKWNNLSQDSVSSKSINSFKSRIYNELFGNGHNTELGSVIKKSVFSQYQFFEHQFSISLS
ncbi:hypothetical protein BpHYR1_021952 [Brachionus plicatilis]|uniref:RNA-directed DNA polymerase from mobile element jockey-like n=1 Tax=Brachionus plicatilis TaxID=10195 RepID=A0A3M7Q094_BRAPC|nr:hypothetical protein BpHYR1_021952 [Brachionus plicatilis]